MSNKGWFHKYKRATTKEQRIAILKEAIIHSKGDKKTNFEWLLEQEINPKAPPPNSTEGFK